MGMPTVLMVAEKPSLAQAIAKILSNDQLSSRRSVSATCPVWEYQGVFFGKPAKFKVTSVTGHIYTCDFPREYNNWDGIEPVKLFDAPTLKLEANPKVLTQYTLMVVGWN
ncbi:DNA topoisomerase 3-beta-1 [Basidiobolus ranarum]|uniref:DNA topoisomerase n=1 Tax=Basidiobolus ranarum TaxID=34480 RepID=A0ABR2WC56_9FUNG